MASIRSKICRMLTRRMISAAFNPDFTIEEMRSTLEKAKHDGVDVTLKIYDQLWHFFHVFYRLMPEAKAATRELSAFIRNHF